MYGDFKISIKRREDHEIIAALQNIYPANDLENAYQKSQCRKKANRCVFNFGYQNQDVLLLARITDGELKITIENLKNREDLIQLKNRIDEYHNQIMKGLKRRKLSVCHSSATITLDKTEINGKWPDKFKDLWEDIRKKGEKIFIEPFSSLCVSFLALHYRIFDVKEYSADIKRTLTILAESYFGVIAILVIKVFIQKTEKKFKFTI